MTKRSNGIKLDETLPLGADLESAAACDRVEAEVQAAMAPGGSGSLFRALWNSFRSRLVGQAPLHAVVVVAELADPMILAQLLMIVGGDDNGHIDLRRGAMYVTAMCVIKLVYRCVREVVVTRDDLTNDLVANALKTLVYRKALRLRALAPYSTGEVLNRINDDPWTISSLTYRVNQSWTTVLHLGGLIAFEYYLIGPSALLTLVCIAVVIAINYKLSARTEALWESNGEISDARVKVCAPVTGRLRVELFVVLKVDGPTNLADCFGLTRVTPSFIDSPNRWPTHLADCYGTTQNNVAKARAHHPFIQTLPRVSRLTLPLYIYCITPTTPSAAY